MKWLPAALLCAALIACQGAGSPTESPTTASETPQPTVEPSPTPTPDPTPSPTPDTAAFDDCVELITPLLEATRQLDARLDIGQTFAEYGDRLEEISVEYDRLTADLSSISADCLTIGSELESAFSAYADAHTAWDACIDDAACDMETVTPKLQEFWATASESIDNAEEALRDRRP